MATYYFALTNCCFSTFNLRLSRLSRRPRRLIKLALTQNIWLFRKTKRNHFSFLYINSLGTTIFGEIVVNCANCNVRLFPDARIPETGEQANKSNYGPDECCYWYCENRLCYQCETRLSELQPPSNEQCKPVEERVHTCAVPYQAPARAPRSPPASPLLIAASALLVLALSGALAPRTHWTVPTPLVNVRNSRL